MDIAEIRRLVKLVEKYDIEELKIEENDFKISINKSKSPGVQQLQPPVIAQPQAGSLNVDSFQHQHKEAPIHEMTSEEKRDENVVEICAPMVGTFYRAPSPDSDPYVNIGDHIKTGTVLCIIEAMKLMNELEAEISGEITDILVENGQSVEYNQPLFLIKKQ
ncbi:MAG: acetyl-CoA carboxylase biotin carboxyl carrier protein [bacterium]